MIIPTETTTVTAIVYDSLQQTKFYLGIVNPGQTIQIRLKPINLSPDQLEYLTLKLNPSPLKIECIHDSKTKYINFKKEY